MQYFIWILRIADILLRIESSNCFEDLLDIVAHVHLLLHPLPYLVLNLLLYPLPLAIEARLVGRISNDHSRLLRLQLTGSTEEALDLLGASVEALDSLLVGSSR